MFIYFSEKQKCFHSFLSDFDIKTANTDGLSQKTFSGHSGPVLSLCFTSDSEGLVS